jgi:hypothetical protein
MALDVMSKLDSDANGSTSACPASSDHSFPIPGMPQQAEPSSNHLPCHTALSMQVRAMRTSKDTALEPVQRNVSAAFDKMMRSLNECYSSSASHAPADFCERINFWHRSCGLPEDFRAYLQTLRIWRNASLHHDRERWQRDGPPNSQVASQHIAALQAMLTKLQPAAVV